MRQVNLGMLSYTFEMEDEFCSNSVRRSSMSRRNGSNSAARVSSSVTLKGIGLGGGGEFVSSRPSRFLISSEEVNSALSRRLK